MTLFHLLYSCISATALAGALILILRLNRRRIQQQPPDENWPTILKRNLPMFEHLTPEQHTRLYGMMHLFLARKKFEGCGGQEITEEIKITIAAQGLPAADRPQNQGISPTENHSCLSARVPERTKGTFRRG